MNPRIVSIVSALLGLAALAAADVITFTNGAAVRGTFLGGDARTIRIEVNSQVRVYQISEVASVVFGDGASQATGVAMQAAGVPPPAIQAPLVQAPGVVMPAAPPLAAQPPAVAPPAIQAPAIQAPAIQAPAVQAAKPKAPKGKRGFLGLGRKKQPEAAPPPAPVPAAQVPVVAVPPQPVAVPPQPVAVPPQPVAVPPQPVAVPPQPVVVPPQPVAVPPQPVVVPPQPVAVPPQPVAVPPQPVAVPPQPGLSPPAAAPPAQAAQTAAEVPVAPVSLPAPVQTVPIGGADGRTIPAGAVLRLRMIDSIDSSVHQAGESFRASLEGEIAAMGDTLLPAGSDVTVRLARIPVTGSLAKPLFRLDIVAVRVDGRNLPLAAEGLPGQDPSSAVPLGAGLAKLVISSDGLAIFRVTRAFRVP